MCVRIAATFWLLCAVAQTSFSADTTPYPDAQLYRKLLIPKPFLITRDGHTFGGDLRIDDREELLLWDPTASELFIYTPKPLDESAYRGYQTGPRQYNPRIMD